MVLSSLPLQQMVNSYQLMVDYFDKERGDWNGCRNKTGRASWLLFRELLFLQLCGGEGGGEGRGGRQVINYEFHFCRCHITEKDRFLSLLYEASQACSKCVHELDQGHE